MLHRYNMSEFFFSKYLNVRDNSSYVYSQSQVQVKEEGCVKLLRQPTKNPIESHEHGSTKMMYYVYVTDHIE